MPSRARLSDCLSFGPAHNLSDPVLDLIQLIVLGRGGGGGGGGGGGEEAIETCFAGHLSTDR